MSTIGTWTVPITTEGIEVELTDNGLWIEIHYPDSTPARRSFVSAPELHRLARIAPEARAAALARLDREHHRAKGKRPEQ